MRYTALDDRIFIVTAIFATQYVCLMISIRVNYVLIIMFVLVIFMGF